jgi:hypothetical protein
MGEQCPAGTLSDAGVEKQTTLADIVLDICDFVLGSVEGVLSDLREGDPFICARFRVPLPEFCRSLINDPVRLRNSFSETPKGFRFKGDLKFAAEESAPKGSPNKSGEFLIESIKLPLGEEVIIIDFYSAHIAHCLLESVTLIAMSISVDAEKKAQELLKEYVSDEQYDMYQLTGCIIHSSEQSNREYLIRRGFPTLVFEREEINGEVRKKFRLGLCAHAGDYYPGTFAGTLCPTDDVISHLLLLRADEDRFWEASGIHLPVSGRLGL